LYIVISKAKEERKKEKHTRDSRCGCISSPPFIVVVVSAVGVVGVDVDVQQFKLLTLNTIYVM
jgi:hypothetical protein